MFQGHFKKVLRVFQGSLNDVSLFSRVFPECFKEVSRKLQGVSKKFPVAWHSSQIPEQIPEQKISNLGDSRFRTGSFQTGLK